jgi:hypothetical protein
MEDKKTLAVTDQREISFYGDDLIAIRAEDGQVYAGFRQMCNALGLDDRSQRRRVQNHTLLAKGYQRGVILTPHRGNQEAGVLRVDLIPLWLSGLSTKSVKEEIRDKLERYQEEAAYVLWQAFQEGRLTAVDPVNFQELLAEDNLATRAYHSALAILQLARSQIIMEAEIKDVRGKLSLVSDRLDLIEAELGDTGRSVTQDQASQISQAVKAIALLWSKEKGANQYGAVYGELYRTFGITSYKNLPESRFGEAMSWLSNWYRDLSGEDPF